MLSYLALAPLLPLHHALRPLLSCFRGLPHLHYLRAPSRHTLLEGHLAVDTERSNSIAFLLRFARSPVSSLLLSTLIFVFTLSIAGGTHCLLLLPSGVRTGSSAGFSCTAASYRGALRYDGSRLRMRMYMPMYSFRLIPFDVYVWAERRDLYVLCPIKSMAHTLMPPASLRFVLPQTARGRVRPWGSSTKHSSHLSR
ncbi:hypothetical protein BD309DRAFT_8895 [Dichomitus squalens]|nr:hypothetical protein BD309DRAFT_8895 [Dichomitus squalens]